MIKLDVGCGKNKKEGFIGVDQYAMEGVDYVCDFRKAPWVLTPVKIVDGEYLPIPGADPVADSSVDEVHSSHFLEHLTNFNDKWERVHFINELYRVMKPGAKATIVVPHCFSNRMYGDPTHKEPIGEMFNWYLSREWRKTQAPHTDKQWNPDGYDCDFEAVWGNGMHPALMARNQEYQQYAMTWYKEAIQDLHITLTKK